MKDAVIYRYIKFKCKRGWVRGTSICKQLRIPLQELQQLDYVKGVGSIGPCSLAKMKRNSDWVMYAKCNDYMASSRYLFTSKKRKFYMIKGRPFRNGVYTYPRRHAPEPFNDYTI